MPLANTVRRPGLYAKGSTLAPDQQQLAKSMFGDRYTGSNIPWRATVANRLNQFIPLEFKSDREWLANTEFMIKSSGALDLRCRACWSTPTFPNGQDWRDHAPTPEETLEWGIAAGADGDA